MVRLCFFWGALNQRLTNEPRSSIHSQTLSDLRDCLTTTAMEAHTRNAASGETAIMEAAGAGRIKSLDTLLDWYERRKVLRPKGWIDLRNDEAGRTALHLACSGGHLECVQSLLRYGAILTIKDDAGKTARDLAVERKKPACVECIDDHLREPESEEEVVEADGSVLTSTQRSKLKKKEREAAERKEKTGGEASAQRQVDMTTRRIEPAPSWDEVAKLCESFDQLRALHDLSSTRQASTIDPALFNLHWLKVLKLKLGPEFKALPGSDLARLTELQQLILSGNPALAELPAQVTSLRNLRVLEIEGCALRALPDGLGNLAALETINVANNALTRLDLEGCSFLACLNAAGNKLADIDNVSWASLTRLTELKVSRNKLAGLPASLGQCAQLATLEAESNAIKELPSELAGLKKLKALKLDGNPIADGKVVRMLGREGKGLRELLKYLGESKPAKPAKPASKKGTEADEAERESSELELDDDEL